MRKNYTKEFKSEVIERFAHGETITAISKTTGLSRGTIYKWLDNAQSEENKKRKPLNLRAFHDLNQKCKRQEMIIDILKSSPCSTTAPLKERYQVIKDLSSKYSETLLCDALNVSRGSYFNHIFRNANENTQIAAKVKMLTPIIEEIYNSSQQTYGARRIQAVLTDRGYNVSKRTISKIMQMHGWFSIQGGAKTLYEANRKRKENILNQQFTVTAPNEVWVSDVTYLQYNNRRYYLCVILDLYARK